MYLNPRLITTAHDSYKALGVKIGLTSSGMLRDAGDKTMLYGTFKILLIQV